jgi:hypothetical protein
MSTIRGNPESRLEKVELLLQWLKSLVLSPSGGGASYTTAQVAAGATYNVKTSDRFIVMDTLGTGPTAGLRSTANLPAPSFIGERHIFVHKTWGVGQTLTQINGNAGGAALVMTPLSEYAASGTNVASVNPQVGGISTYEWDGTEWVST